MVRILDVAAKPHKMLLLRPPVFLSSFHLPALIKLKTNLKTHTYTYTQDLPELGFDIIKFYNISMRLHFN